MIFLHNFRVESDNNSERRFLEKFFRKYVFKVGTNVLWGVPTLRGGSKSACGFGPRGPRIWTPWVPWSPKNLFYFNHKFIFLSTHCV